MNVQCHSVSDSVLALFGEETGKELRERHPDVWWNRVHVCLFYLWERDPERGLRGPGVGGTPREIERRHAPTSGCASGTFIHTAFAKRPIGRAVYLHHWVYHVAHRVDTPPEPQPRLMRDGNGRITVEYPPESRRPFWLLRSRFSPAAKPRDD
jgi:hypothetical protein